MLHSKSVAHHTEYIRPVGIADEASFIYKIYEQDSELYPLNKNEMCAYNTIIVNYVG